jgi:hypothetical protein
MMQTCVLTDGFVRTGINCIDLRVGQCQRNPLADLMMADGRWPSGTPLYSAVRIPRERLPGGVLARLMLGERRGQLVWLDGAVHAVSLYEDRHRMISTALAVLALTQPGPPVERDAAPPMQDRDGCHPRYRCEDHVEYVTDHALPPYTVG